MCDSSREPVTVSKKRPASPERRPGGDEDPDLECGICTELLNDARQAPCCAGLACCACLDTAARKSSTCPFCRAALTVGTGLRDLRMERRAANTVRTCPHAGCAYSGKRDEMRVHEEQCDRRPCDEVVASLRARIAELEATLERKESEHAACLTRHATELAAARNVSAEYERLAIKFAFSEKRAESSYTPCLRAINNRFAFRFEWRSASEYVWTGGFRHGSVGINVRVRKGNNTITLEVERTSEDGDARLERVEVVSPRGFSQSHTECIYVPEKQGRYNYARLGYSFEAFEECFVHEGAFIIAV